ncbi:MAG: N-acetylmuramoyl-L-alanine amidase [Bacteroidota bacterium]|nr:N-acetylmuramoyl-L-alanine amidase [Bacteroidota bacterium]
MKLSYLIIHCTATPAGREISAAEIRRWHTSPVKKGGRGWKQVGYADMIHLNGQVENLVPYDADAEVEPWEITNGAAGYNARSRHVVYVGGTDKDGQPEDTRTIPQRIALRNYITQTIAQHPDIRIAGHSSFAAKACPSFDAVQWLRGVGVPVKNIQL